jgi:hypothetical protein
VICSTNTINVETRYEIISCHTLFADGTERILAQQFPSVALNSFEPFAVVLIRYNTSLYLIQR